LEHGKSLLSLDIPKVVFLEPHVIAMLQDSIARAPQTVVIPFTKEDMEFWPERPRFLTCPLPLGANPAKDTHDYILIQLNKVSWCTAAARFNPFKTLLFTWIDFGINYIMNGVSLKDAVSYIIPQKVYPSTIRIAGCQYFSPPHHHPSQLVWKYCGGLFCGDLAMLQRMQTDQRTVVVQLLDSNIVTWEVTVWYYMQAPYLDRYIAYHNATMFTHF
jgi:hypothetical protein